MEGPSLHLSWDELACHDPGRTPYPDCLRPNVAPRLAREFERVRSACGGRPITVGSGYRTTLWNGIVDGGEFSQHPLGTALDLYPPTGWTIARFYEAIYRIARQTGSAISGLGLYPNFVHIDIRVNADDTLTVWEGDRAWAEVKDGKRES